MPTRRQQKVARLVREIVSDAIMNRLNDPRIEGFVSITRVEPTADLRTADVYISIFGGSQAEQRRTFAAITHARSRLQALLSSNIKSRFCPVLRFYEDDKFKQAIETIGLINKAAGEFADKNIPEDGKDVQAD